MAFERSGWGAYASQPAPPITLDSAALCCRELTLRLSLEAVTDAAMSPTLEPHFAEGEGASLHARLVRLLKSLHRLLNDELRGLRDRVRYVSRERPLVSAHPEGGRLDVLATVRLSLVRHGDAELALEGPYHLCRNERLCDTPVNRVLVSILRNTEATLGRILRGQAGTLYFGERSLFVVALRTLRAFLRDSPLGGVPWAGETPEELLPLARKRRVELLRVRSLCDWWREFQKNDLQALRAATAQHELSELSLATCYEMLAALGLLLHARARFPLLPAGGDAATFLLPEPRGGTSGRLAIRFGVHATPGARYGRPASAHLTLMQGDRDPREVLIEARNFSEAAARDVATRLEDWCHARPGERAALLLTPAAAPVPEEGPVRWRPFLGDLTSDPGAVVGNPVGAWEPLLNQLLLP